MPRLQTVEDVVEHLRERLGSDVRILAPDEFRVPLDYVPLGDDGRPKTNAPRGAAAFLKQQAPEGYVQVHEPSGGITAENGWADQQFLTVHTVALSHAAAKALAAQVRAAIGATSRRGGNLRVQLPPELISNPGDPFYTVVTQYRLSSAFTRSI